MTPRPLNRPAPAAASAAGGQRLALRPVLAWCRRQNSRDVHRLIAAVVRMAVVRMAVLAATVWVSAGPGFVHAQTQTPALGPARPAAAIAPAEAAPLTAQPGSIDRGREVVLRQDKGNCILCHAVPEPSVRFSGDVGPPLHGVGARLGAGQIRHRVMDASQSNPDTVMPPYHRLSGLSRVARQYQGQPVLGAQEIEDLVAYLVSLK